jgi:hypothetical protein
VAWTIDPEPLLSIGLTDGAQEYLFEFVVVARILPNGNLVVGDRGSVDFRIFDSTGKFLHRFGGEGQGPGEFRYFDHLFIRGDTLIVNDPMNGKIARFDLSGDLIVAERSPRAMASLVGIGADGALWYSWLAGQGSGPAPQIRADSLVVARFAPDGSLQAEFWGTSGLWRMDKRPHPFSPSARPVFFRESIIRVNALAAELLLLDRDGVVRQAITIPAERPARDRAWSVLEEALRDRSDSELMRRLRDMPRDIDLPRISSVLVDEDDFIWVKEYDPREDAHWLGGWAGGEGGTWWILDAQGRVRQSIRVPGRVLPLSIAGSKLVGRSVDELGINRVVVHRIIGR